MRSKLFVPCSRPDLFDKALAGSADAISFDLEDAVPDDGKAAARTVLSEFLSSAAVRASTKTIIVRVNALNTQFFAADLLALPAICVDLVNVPKVASAADVCTIVDALDAAGLATPLLVNIESAAGLAHAAEIAAAHSRVAGLQVGLNDLFASLGIDRRDPRHVQAALWSVRVAAGTAGCFAYDGAWPDLADDDGLRREAELSQSLGFLGKSCVHPRQVPIVDAVFDQSDHLAQASQLLAEAATAARDGRGAFTLDGVMIDRPSIEQARRTVAAGKARR